jgi:hypothetical protein
LGVTPGSRTRIVTTGSSVDARARLIPAENQPMTINKMLLAPLFLIPVIACTTKVKEDVKDDSSKNDPKTECTASCTKEKDECVKACNSEGDCVTACGDTERECTVDCD